MRIIRSVLAICVMIAGLSLYPASAKLPPISDYLDPAYQALSAEDAILGCDQYASHPLDPLKPEGIEGITSDADVANDTAFLYCHKALQSDQTNPRVLFQWGRVNYARNPTMTGQPRQMFTLAYRDGSEIAGVYLSKLPPEQRMSLDEMIASMEAMKGRRGPQRRMSGQERDELLLGSIVVIGSVALLRILNGDAKWPSGECSGGYAINASTHEVVCNGLVVGAY